jgi:hypothetical protein
MSPPRPATPAARKVVRPRKVPAAAPGFSNSEIATMLFLSEGTVWDALASRKVCSQRRFGQHRGLGVALVDVGAAPGVDC